MKEKLITMTVVAREDGSVVSAEARRVDAHGIFRQFLVRPKPKMTAPRSFALLWMGIREDLKLEARQADEKRKRLELAT